MSVDGNLERNYNYRSLKQALTGYLISQNVSDGAKHMIGKKQKKKQAKNKDNKQ